MASNLTLAEIYLAPFSPMLILQSLVYQKHAFSVYPDFWEVF